MVSQNLIYDYDDLVYGIVKNYPPSKAKKLREVNQREFLHSPELIKKYGFWSNTDKDLYPNFADSFPFDSTRHGLVAPQTETLQESQARLGLTPQRRLIQQPQFQVQEIQPEKSAQEQEIESLQHNIKVTSERIEELNKTRGSHTQGQSAAYADLVDTLPRLERKLALMEEGYSENYAREVAFRRASPERRQAETQARDIRNYENFYRNSLIGGGYTREEAQKIVERNRPYYKPEYGEAVKDYMKSAGIQSIQPISPSDLRQSAQTQQSLPPEVSKRISNIQKDYQKAGYTNKQSYTLALESERQQRSFIPGEAEQVLKRAEDLEKDGLDRPYTRDTRGLGIQDTGDIRSFFGLQVDLSKVKEIPSKAWGEIKELESSIFRLTEEGYKDLGIKTKIVAPSYSPFRGLKGGIDLFGLSGEGITIEELKKGEKPDTIKLNKAIEETSKATENLNKYKDLIQGETFIGTEEEYKNYQKDFLTYEKKFQEYESLKQKVEEKTSTLFGVLKTGGEELLYKAVQLSPETPGGFALRGAEAYGIYRLGAGALRQAGRVYAGLAPEEQLVLSKGVSPSLDIFIGYEGVKGFMNPELSPGQRVVSLGFGLTGIGSLTGKLTKANLEAVTKIDDLAKTKPKINPVIKQQFSVDDAVLIRTETDGSKVWQVNGEVKTFIKDAKTGKTIEKISTETYSEVVTSQTKEGAIKATTETYTSSLEKYGVRKYDGKATIKTQAGKASGEFTFRPSDINERIMIGRGESTIYDYGRFKGRMTPEEIRLRLSPKKAQAEQKAMTEILGIDIGEKEAERKLGDLIVKGRERGTLSLYRADVYPERLAVRQYYRRVEPESFWKRFLEIPEEKLVQPYVRKFSKEQLGKREFQFGLSTSFKPEDMIANLKGIEFEELGLKARLPKTKPKVTKPFSWLEDIQVKEIPARELPKVIKPSETGDSLKLIFGDTEKVAARQAAEAEVRQVIKPKVKPRIKPSELGKLWQGEIFGIKGIELLGLGVKEKQKTKEQYRFGKIGLANLGLSLEREKVEEGLIQPVLSKQPLELKQVSELEMGIPGKGTGTFFFPMEVPPTEPTIIKPIYLPKGKEEYKKEKPYDAYGYIDATKTNKARYEKLNEEPLTLTSALGLMARYVDENISRRGKVTPTPAEIQKGKKGKESKKILPKAQDTKDDYFEIYNQKFRPYRVQRGQKKPLNPGTYIEKERFALDRPGEVRTIQKEKRRAESIKDFFGI